MLTFDRHVTISYSFTGDVKSLIFEGGVFVDVSFAPLRRNGYNQLDYQKKKDIENVLIDEFCSLDVKAQPEDNSCAIQNLKFRVKKEYQLWNFLKS